MLPSSKDMNTTIYAFFLVLYQYDLESCLPMLVVLYFQNCL
jgi:hypothetical protein